MEIRRIGATDARPIRWAVLRPELAGPDELVNPGDDHPGAAHFGAFGQDGLIGVASMLPEAHPDHPAPGDWRLRGMAVADGRRSGGTGRMLLDTCLEHGRDQGGRRVWCNARIAAVEFYERAGFVAEGGQFLAAGDRPHLRMSIDLPGTGA